MATGDPFFCMTHQSGAPCFLCALEMAYAEEDGGGRGMTDERQCRKCGELRVSHLHDMTRTLCCGGKEHHPFEAAPSTDEGEASGLIVHRDYEENGGGWWSVNYSDGKGFPVHVPDVVEAAIRAPLEERIRELERQLAFWREESFSSMQTRDVYHSRAEAAEADNERLREALRALVDKILGPDEGSEAWDELVDLADVGMRALATPPSSTEGTKEVEG